MKKIGIFLSVMLLLAFIFNGCSNASSSGNSSLQGTWNCIPMTGYKITLKITGADFEIISYVNNVLDEGYRGTFTTSGNTLTTSTTSQNLGSGWSAVTPAEVHAGTYSLSGNTLTIAHQYWGNSTLTFTK